MFRLVSKFKLIGMVLNVVQGQVKKKRTKTYNKGFPNHSTLINYGSIGRFWISEEPQKAI